MRKLVTVALLVFLVSPIVAQDILLEDYQSGGKFSVADWSNSFEDDKGNKNAAIDDGDFAAVSWATKWSGIPSTGETMDVSAYKTYQADVMVPKGQPVEDDSNFYFQLTTETSEGYAYWEKFIPQSKIPADGKWYRVHFPIKMMDTGSGEGAEAPTDFKTINGCVCGMTYDEDGDKFKFKHAMFDNITLTTKEIDGIKVTNSPKTVNPPKKKK